MRKDLGYRGAVPQQRNLKAVRACWEDRLRLLLEPRRRNLHGLPSFAASLSEKKNLQDSRGSEEGGVVDRRKALEDASLDISGPLIKAAVVLQNHFLNHLHIILLRSIKPL